MIFRFGPYEVDDALFELRRSATVIPLQRRVFDLLHYLVRQPDIVHTKEQLLENLWSDSVVTKDVLPRAMMALRNALGDDVDHPTFIHTVRGRGYRFITSVVHHELAKPVAAPVAAPGALVGRDGVLLALRERIRRARDGEGGIVLVIGEPGVGKTRLLEEIAKAPGGSRLALMPYSASQWTPDLWLLSEALRALDVSVSVEPSLLESAEKRHRLFEGIVRALIEAAALTPLLLLIDNLDLADERTLDVLELLAPRLAQARVLVVATHRPPSPQGARFGAAYGVLTSVSSTTVERLKPLARAECALFLEHVLAKTVSEAIVDRVYEKTLGNPLLVSQLVHVLRADSSLSVDTLSTTALVGDDAMREAIVHRLASLPPSVLRVLTTAAVFGRGFALAPLAAALESTNAVVLRELDVASVARIVAPAEHGTYSFTYPLVRDVIYKRLPATERSRLHGLVADALEEHLGGLVEHQSAGTIAHHLVEAAAAGDVDRAVDWSLRAVALAIEAGDAATSAGYAARGLEALRYAQKPDPEKRAKLQAASALTKR